MKTLFTGRLLLDTFGLSREFLKLDEYGLPTIMASLNKDFVAPNFTSHELELRASSQFLKELLVKL